MDSEELEYRTKICAWAFSATGQPGTEIQIEALVEFTEQIPAKVLRECIKRAILKQDSNFTPPPKAIIKEYLDERKRRREEGPSQLEAARAQFFLENPDHPKDDGNIHREVSKKIDVLERKFHGEEIAS